MNGAVRPVAAPLQVDWPGWDEALRGFAGGTGLCVCAYDVDAVRRVGPHAASPLAIALRERGAWGAGGQAGEIERRLVREVLQSGCPAEHSVDAALKVAALPLASSSGVAGVVVFGWVLTAFTSLFGCQRLGALLGVHGEGLWAEARRESPVPAARLAMSGQLLQTLIDSAGRHAAAMGKVEALARTRAVFLAGVSHELRTPLGALSMRIELLQRSRLDDPEAIRASLAHMKRHVTEEARLVEDLIDAASTRTGQLTIERHPVALQEVVDAAISAVRPGAQDKNLTFVMPHGDALGDCRVLADPHRMKQVFWNVLSNAVKFTPAGGSVIVSAESTADYCRVEVADSGPGIDAELLPHIFEPFTRQRRGNERGMGLGLSIARQIIQLHDGELTVRNGGPGHGAIFRMQLPRVAHP